MSEGGALDEGAAAASQRGARACSVCGVGTRFNTQAALIKHLADAHSVEAIDEATYYASHPAAAAPGGVIGWDAEAAARGRAEPHGGGARRTGPSPPP